MDIQYLIDHESWSANYVPIRCQLDGKRLVITGLNLIQADPVLGQYIELELEEE